MDSLRKTARLAGLFWFLLAASTGFGLVYVRPKLIVFADAAATAGNIVAHESLFRASIACGVLGQIFLLLFGVTVFRLFKEAERGLATFLLASVLPGVAVGVVNSLNHLGAVLVLTSPEHLRVFQPEQLSALAMIFLRLHNFGVGLLEIFTALLLFSLGLLIIRTRYLPRVLGVLLIVGACAFPFNTFTKILFPQFYPAQITRLTMLLNAAGSPATILWLLIKGVRVPHG